jgi:NitT/TauT family transport system ATP-binding protein
VSRPPDLIGRLLAPHAPGPRGATLAPGAREPAAGGTIAEAGAGGRLELHGIRRTFDAPRERLVALDDVDLTIEAGEIVALIGPNGSGKSTLLRVIAGLLPPDSGRVLLDDREVRGPDPDIGLVFQEPRLLPWRTVAGNVGYPLELAGHPISQRRQRVAELLELVGLEEASDLVPARLSGGMRQRTALARGLALSPDVLLLDEPFSALDALTRERFNIELLRLWSRMRSTILLVTHSIPEAILVADRVVVLSPRPGHVVADLPVPFGRPRRPDVLDAPEAGALAGRIRALLGDGR